jgi:enamine deaminase RidA (YjgF/YER057c/UK114 family)
MTIRRIQPGARFSEAVIHGQLVHLSGQVALDAAGRSMTEQTKEVLTRIDSLLHSAGTDRSRLVSALVLLSDLKRIGEFNAIWDEWLGGVAPARTAAQAELADPGWWVEVTAVAALPDGAVP